MPRPPRPPRDELEAARTAFERLKDAVQTVNHAEGLIQQVLAAFAACRYSASFDTLRAHAECTMLQARLLELMDQAENFHKRLEAERYRKTKRPRKSRKTGADLIQFPLAPIR